MSYGKAGREERLPETNTCGLAAEGARNRWWRKGQEWGRRDKVVTGRVGALNERNERK